MTTAAAGDQKIGGGGGGRKSVSILKIYLLTEAVIQTQRASPSSPETTQHTAANTENLGMEGKPSDVARTPVSNFIPSVTSASSKYFQRQKRMATACPAYMGHTTRLKDTRSLPIFHLGLQKQGQTPLSPPGRRTLGG